MDKLVNKDTCEQENVPIRIVSACLYVRAGLQNLVSFISSTAICVADEASGLSQPVLVFIPDEPLPALQALRELVDALRSGSAPVKSWVLTDIEPGWLYRALVRMTGSCRHVSAVRLLSSGAGVEYLLDRLSGEPAAADLLSVAAGHTHGYSGWDKKTGLSQCEADVVAETLRGMSVKLMAVQKKRSCKTLYQQKASGLKKMAEVFPSVVARVSGHRRKAIDSQLSQGCCDTAGEN